MLHIRQCTVLQKQPSSVAGLKTHVIQTALTHAMGRQLRPLNGQAGKIRLRTLEIDLGKLPREDTETHFYERLEKACKKLAAQLGEKALNGSRELTHSTSSISKPTQHESSSALIPGNDVNIAQKLLDLLSLQNNDDLTQWLVSLPDLYRKRYGQALPESWKRLLKTVQSGDTIPHDLYPVSKQLAGLEQDVSSTQQLGFLIQLLEDTGDRLPDQEFMAKAYQKEFGTKLPPYLREVIDQWHVQTILESEPTMWPHAATWSPFFESVMGPGFELENSAPLSAPLPTESADPDWTSKWQKNLMALRESLGTNWLKQLTRAFQHHHRGSLSPRLYRQLLQQVNHILELSSDAAVSATTVKPANAQVNSDQELAGLVNYLATLRLGGISEAKPDNSAPILHDQKELDRLHELIKKRSQLLWAPWLDELLKAFSAQAGLPFNMPVQKAEWMGAFMQYLSEFKDNAPANQWTSNWENETELSTGSSIVSPAPGVEESTYGESGIKEVSTEQPTSEAAPNVGEYAMQSRVTAFLIRYILAEPMDGQWLKKLKGRFMQRFGRPVSKELLSAFQSAIYKHTDSTNETHWPFKQALLDHVTQWPYQGQPSENATSQAGFENLSFDQKSLLELIQATNLAPDTWFRQLLNAYMEKYTQSMPLPLQKILWSFASAHGKKTNIGQSENLVHKDITLALTEALEAQSLLPFGLLGREEIGFLKEILILPPNATSRSFSAIAQQFELQFKKPLPSALVTLVQALMVPAAAEPKQYSFFDKAQLIQFIEEQNIFSQSPGQVVDELSTLGNFIKLSAEHVLINDENWLNQLLTFYQMQHKKPMPTTMQQVLLNWSKNIRLHEDWLVQNTLLRHILWQINRVIGEKSLTLSPLQQFVYQQLQKAVGTRQWATHLNRAIDQRFGFTLPGYFIQAINKLEVHHESGLFKINGESTRQENLINELIDTFLKLSTEEAGNHSTQVLPDRPSKPAEVRKPHATNEEHRNDQEWRQRVIGLFNALYDCLEGLQTGSAEPLKLIQDYLLEHGTSSLGGAGLKAEFFKQFKVNLPNELIESLDQLIQLDHDEQIHQQPFQADRFVGGLALLKALWALVPKSEFSETSSTPRQQQQAFVRFVHNFELGESHDWVNTLSEAYEQEFGCLPSEKTRWQIAQYKAYRWLKLKGHEEWSTASIAEAMQQHKNQQLTEGEQPAFEQELKAVDFVLDYCRSRKSPDLNVQVLSEAMQGKLGHLIPYSLVAMIEKSVKPMVNKVATSHATAVENSPAKSTASIMAQGRPNRSRAIEPSAAARALDLKKTLLRLARKEPDPTKKYHISGAGIILGWPFFKRQFDQLNWIQEGKFVDLQGMGGAILAANWLARLSGTTEDQTINPLIRLICNLDPEKAEWLSDQHLNEYFPKGSFQSSINDFTNLLLAMWPVLKPKQQIEFRELFLQREGWLSKNTIGWELHLVQAGYDQAMLAKAPLPWPLQKIFFPWNTQTFNTLWQT